MFKKYASLALIVTLVCALCGATTFAQTSRQTDVRFNEVKESTNVASAVNKEEQPGRGLKADLQKLVADARAGKSLSITEPQQPPKQSNSLSKEVKIGLIVGIAAAVILIIVFVHQKNHLFDDFTLQ